MATGRRQISLIDIRANDQYLNSKPQLKEMYTLITPEYAAYWKVIGTLLGMSKGRLDTIELTYPINVHWCCNKMLETWLEINPAAIWKDIITTIDSRAIKETQYHPVSPKYEVPNYIAEDVVEKIMLQLSDDVKANYIQTRYIAQEDMWRLLHPKHFVNVLLIHHMERRGEKEIVDVASMMRQGLSHESIELPSMRNTTEQPKKSSYSVSTNDISDIFMPFKKKDNSTVIPNVILIDGAPGMGKTTLCKEIAYRWANSLLLNDIKVLFFIYLRDPDIVKILNLENFIHYFYNFDEAAKEFSRQCADILIHRKNDDIAIVLDGYDEYADEVGNLFLTRVLNRKAFTHCKLIITTRPIATDRLQSNADIRVEVMGFNDDSKKEYIQQELSDSTKKEKLCTYLEKNKDINSICYMPMIMTILVFTFKEIEELPTNKIELYNKFITVAVSRYVQKLEDMPQKDILPLQKLPTIYKTYLLELSNFAYETLRTDKIVFTKTDVQQFCPNLALDKNNYQGLGLLKSTQYFSMKKVDTCISYNFLHLSIQEYLAAYYICNQEVWMQFNLLRSTIFFEKYMNVWIMHADLNKYAMSEFYNYLVQCNGISMLKGLYSKLQYFNAIETFNELLQNYVIYDSGSTWQIYCFKNTEVELPDFFNTHNDNFEGEKICLLNKIISGNTWNKLYLSLHHNNHSDKKPLETFVIDVNKKENAYWKIALKLFHNKCLSVMITNTTSLIGYRANTEQFNSCFNINNSINKFILRECFISDETSALLSSFIENSKVVMFNVVGCTFSRTGSKVTFNSLSHVTTIGIMSISDISIDEDTACAIANAIVNNTNLIHLEISNINLQEEAAMKIVTALKNIPSLKNLILPNINLSEHICDDLAVAIWVNSNLEMINLSNNHLQYNAVVVAQALNQLTRLKHLKVSNNNMSDNVVDALALAIERNPILTSLYLKGNSLTTLGMIKIVQSLSWSSNLSVLDISNNHIKEEAADAIAIALLNNTNIKELYLSDNNLGTGIVKIAAALQNISSLTVLDLNNNNSSEAAANQLAVVAGKNKLEMLFLANNNLKLGTAKIAWALSNIYTLIELNLNNNGITNEVACSLAAAIESNASLTTLKLSNNKLQAVGIQTISQSLRKISSLQVLHIDYNQITKDASSSIAYVLLNNKNLRQLWLHNNELQDGIIEIVNALKYNRVIQQLVLSDNNMSESVADAIANALKNMASLKQFAVMNNRLKTKGIITVAKSLSCLSELTVLNIHNNQINKQAGDAIASVIQNNSNLEDLSLGENNFTGAGKVVASLKDAYALKVMHLRNCRLTENVAEDLRTALMNKHSLKKLILQGNYLKSNGIITISKSLRCISSLTLINLYNNQLTEEAGKAVASIILNNSKLEALYLGGNKLRTGALKVMSALKHISTLTDLDFDDNNITQCVAEELAAVINCNFSLSDLSLRNNELKTEGFIIVAKALSKLSTLKSLNVRNNQISKEAIDDLVFVLSRNKNMTHLYLGINNFQEGAVKIVAALNYSTINILDLDNNNIPSSVIHQLLADILHNCHGIKTLWCRRNNLCLHDESFLIQIFSSTITSLDLSDNYMNDAVADQLAIIIANNKSLENLCLRNNNFKSRGAIKIMQTFSTLKTLKTLNLGGNLITDDTSDSIASVISNNPDLTELYLGHNHLANGILKIAKALEKTSKIKVLHLDSNSINELVAESLALVFSKSNIEDLNLSYNNLYSWSSSQFNFKALSKISSLKCLNLSTCCMTDTVAEYLAAVIDSNDSLNTIRIQNNHFNTQGIVTIAKSLSRLSTLKILNIRNIVLRTKEAVEAVSSLLKNNCIIEQFYYGENIIQSQAAELMANLKAISTLITLNLINIKLKENDVDNLVAVIKNNPLLERLCLAGNSLMSTGLTKILTACKINNRNLRLLDVQSNSVGPETMAAIPFDIFNFHYVEAFHLGGITLTTVETLFYEILLYFMELDCNSTLGIPLVGHFRNTFFVCHQSKLLEICSLLIRNRLISYYSKWNYNDTYIICFSYTDHVFSNEIDENFLSQNMLKTEATDLKLSNIKAASLFCFPLIKKLKAVSLEFNNIDENAAFELAAMLHCNKVLQQLWLKGNKLNAAGALFILNSLEYISTLKVLDLSYNNITYQIANNLADVITKNHTLEQLWLDGNNLLSKGVVRISTAICKLTTLRILSLSNNQITDEAADKLSIIPNNCVLLEDLSLSNNDFQTAGICTIAQSLFKLARLRKLELFNNRITEAAAEKLADALSNCQSLQELYLSDNMLKSTGTRRILQALKFNFKLQILTLSNNGITDTIVGDLSDVLINNRMFCVLLIGENDLKTAAALKIAKVVKAHNTGMQLLNLCDNNVSSQGKDEINAIFSPVMHMKLFI